ncbi:MAG TPA: hypothetical protein VMN57_10950 [Anaerolineales bacterium]|nr:hypothetical protein [Anaerolineales bacterium]
MVTPITHILPYTTVQRRRLLPREGRVVVRQGQAVRATDVIATAVLKPSHTMLDVAAGLGVTRSAAAGFIERYEGDKLETGDVVARKTGLFNRVVRSPVAGRIVLMTDGYVLIEEKQQPFELQAGIPGEVAELMHEFGAVIETTGALIQGIWGNGMIDFGVLTVLAENPGDELQAGQVDVSLRGAVLMAGTCRSPEAFQRAADQRLRGLILGSMPSELIPAARRLPFPLILTDGFGTVPMNQAAFRLLSTSQKRDIALNAEPHNPETGVRPEILIPLPPSDAETAIEVGRLETGQRVQVMRAPHKGAWGVVESILPGRTLFPNGLRLPAAQVRLEAGESIRVPTANLEIINSS